MRKTALAFIIGWLCCTTCGNADWLPDYISNGDFEADANGDGVADGWQGYAYESPGSFAWDREVGHSSRAAVRLSDSFSEDRSAWQKYCARWVSSQQQATTPGAKYTLRAWIKTELTDGSADVRVSWSGGGKWLAEDRAGPVAGTSDWTQVSVVATAPAQADALRVFCHLSGGKGSAWYDDVQLVKGEALPGNYRPVDISAACTTGFADEVAGDGRGGWTDQGPNDLRQLPPGRQNWRGVPFDIVDPAANGGRACIVLRGRSTPNAPREVEVPVGLTCDVLHFLHTCAWAGRADTLAATYRIRYADGQTVDVPVRNGREVFDWWSPADTQQCAVGWEGANAESDTVGLAIFPWTNPRPGAEIASVTALASGDEPVAILVAVTAADGPPVLTPRPVRLQLTDKTGWYEWAFALLDPALGEIDLSFLLDAPAGKHGFVTVREDGHFYFEDGQRARFFGTNVGGSGCCPPKEMAPIIARRLACFGVNLLRLHSADSRWGGIIDYSSGTSRQLNAEALDRYDYFIAQLKEQGIYVYFDLFDYRTFLPGDGIPWADQFVRNWYLCPKGASEFDPTLVELQKEFATQLLTHRNPYTGNRYVDEPALAVQEITNENSLFYLQNTNLTLPVYIEALKKLWNEWLLERYGNRAALAAAWTRDGVCALATDEDPARGNVALPLRHMYDDLTGVAYDAPNSPARVNSMTRFLMELQAGHLREMYDHLRSIGLKCPITGTNQDFSDASNAANAVCDFTSRNNYWRHPNVHATPYITFHDDAMVASDIVMEATPIANIASSTVEGKPMIAPEFNFPWPNQYRAECLPLMAAYGCLQDWDGLLYFSYRADEPALVFFNNQSDPVRWGQVPAAALIFHRGYVSPARNTVHIGCSRVDQVSGRRSRTADHYSPYRVLPYISRVRNVYFDEVYEGDADVVMSSGHSAHGDYSQAQRAIVFADWPYADELATTLGPQRPDNPVVRDDPAWLHRLFLTRAQQWGLPSAADPEEAGTILRSDTGELILNRETGLFAIDTPTAQGAVGFLGDKGAIVLGDVLVECATDFASVLLVSLDGEPIARSRRMLLTAVSRSENTGEACSPGRRALIENGRPPVLAQPVDCRVTIGGAAVRAYALSPTGEKLGQLPVADGAIETREARSPWVLLEG